MIKLPVQIKRQPDEHVRQKLYDYYLNLLLETRDPIYQHGQWYLFELKSAGPNDGTHGNMLAYGWRNEAQNYRLVVVNLTPIPSYARLPLSFWSDLAGKKWCLHDVIDGTMYDRDGTDMATIGLFVALEPYESHVFRFEQVTK